MSHWEAKKQFILSNNLTWPQNEHVEKDKPESYESHKVEMIVVVVGSQAK